MLYLEFQLVEKSWLGWHEDVKNKTSSQDALLQDTVIIPTEILRQTEIYRSESL